MIEWLKNTMESMQYLTLVDDESRRQRSALSGFLYFMTKKQIEDKLTVSSIKILRQTLKASKGFILIYNGDKGKTLYLWNDICSHEVKSLIRDAIAEMEEFERQQDEDDETLVTEPKKIVN